MSWWSSFCGAQPFRSGSTKRLLCFPLDDAVVAGIAALAPAGSELASPADVESIAFTWEAVCIAPLRLNAPLPPCIRRGDFFVLRDDWMQVSFHSGVAGAGRSPSAERGRIRHRPCDPEPRGASGPRVQRGRDPSRPRAFARRNRSSRGSRAAGSSRGVCRHGVVQLDGSVCALRQRPMVGPSRASSGAKACSCRKRPRGASSRADSELRWAQAQFCKE